MKKIILLILLCAVPAAASLIVAPSTPDNSLQGKKTKVADQLRIMATQNFKLLSQSTQSIFITVWKNPSLTPQQVYDAMGQDAAALRQLLSSIADSLNALAPGTLTLTEPCPTISNNDGTVSVFCPSPSPSPTGK